ncbi:MAG: circularly permuted type 2 ATP-grasp protein, partial [Gemmatimonadales bacterium]|nr:circularly permuted type 2 ATP-grasp protein [Gemmatimonadales bacterium]
RRGLVFGDRPVATVLRPRFMSLPHYRLLQQRVRVLMRAFGKAYERALADQTFRGQFRLAEWEERLIRHDPGFREPSPTSRVDAFVMDGAGTMAVTEYNAETPAGAGYNDALVASFADLPIMRAFGRRYEALPLFARHGVLHVLLDAYEEWAGRRHIPRVAIVDWPEVPTRSEFVLFQEYFGAVGIEAVIADPRELEFRGGRLFAEGGPVDLVYKRVLLAELVERCGFETPLLQAVAAGAVCMVNPPRSKILHKKASLAVLSDERNQPLFGAEERESIAAHIPWTRVMEERHTEHGGTGVDLVPFVLAARERLVLKPNDDYGGAGIVLGWEADTAEWERAVANALASPYIVQERVPIPSEPYPSLVDGHAVFADRMMDTAPFVSHGDYAEGCLTRLSTAALLNVTAGGGSTIPTFVVEQR